MHFCQRLIVVLLCAIVFAMVGCSFEPARPRTRADIQRDQEHVDTLYISEDGTEFVAPGTEQGMVVNPNTGKLAFRAWQCNNPNCPARKPDGSPYIFPLPDPFAFVDEQGKPRVRQPATPAELKQVDEYYDRKCPACAKQRNLAQETDAVRQQYQGWLELHVLPQAKERLAELAEEYRRYVEAEQKRTGK